MRSALSVKPAIALISVIVVLRSTGHAQCLTDLTDIQPYTLGKSGQVASYPVTNAFNNSNDATAGWQESKHVTGGNPSWVTITFTSGAQVVRGYSISAMDYNGIGNTIAPTNWTFQGWNGLAWVTLDTRTGVTFTAGQTQIFTTGNNTAYTEYRLNITKVFSSTTTMGVAQIQLFSSVCLTGRVFEDGGSRDKVYTAANGDALLNGVTVSLVNETLGSVAASTTTNALGVYNFTSAQIPAAGNFSVIVTPPAGHNFVSETTNLLNSSIVLPSPEEEPSSGSVLFDYYQNQQATFSTATNRMTFAGGNLDFGLMLATPASTLACGGSGSVGTNLITIANNGTFGTASGALTTIHPHQRAFTIAGSSLYNSLPAANTTYTFSNTQANPGSNSSGTLYVEGDYNITSYLGTISDLADQPYMPSLADSYNGTGWRKTFGATTGDMYDQFLAVNGSASSGQPFFQQSGIALAGGTSYSLSFFGKHADSYAQVVALGNINDAPVLATVTDNSNNVIASTSITLTAPTSYTQDRPETPWQFGTMSFVAPASGGPFTVSLTASSSAVNGNDLYIDNITLTPCSYAIVLPLTITGFTAKPDEAGNVQLQWNIADPEAGTTIIEYSSDGIHFEPLSSLPILTSIDTYQYLHMHPGRQYNYYRLKMAKAAGGNSFYSDIRLVTFNSNHSRIVLFPNPTANSACLTGTSDISDVIVTNAAGQTILSISTDHADNLTLNTAAWKSGIYFIKLIGKSGTSLQQLLIAR